uniref:Uncharacterized protein n=1 Tax=viral metagenome TaxID=1070528 RepID=A0A6C0AYP2_9ZZZZ|tara:strand:+ start:6452 stop:6862 length:411 start_codon:yes stop_codon:yes gene_type:complete
MLNYIDKINMLPYELQEHIYQYYWSNIYLDVLNEIKSITALDTKINIFINKYQNNIIKENNNFYYRKFNDSIRKITHNKGKMLLCNYNNLSLRNCNIKYIFNICSTIRDDYKYIAPVLISKSNFMRYNVYQYLKSL